MNEQLNMITPKQIQEIIDSFKEEDRPLVAKLMQRMTQFGNMQSLNKIAAYVKKQDGGFINSNLMCINNAMNYLANGKNSFGRLY